MKTLRYFMVILVLIGITILGCSDKSKTPVQPTDKTNTLPSLMKTSGPGAWMVKGTSKVLLLFYDKNSGLAVALGVNNITNFCSGNGGLDEVDIREILLPNADPNLRREIDHIKDTVFARVWNADPRQYNLCDFFNTVPEKAEGVVNLRITNNNVFADLQSRKTSVSWGYKANGTLHDQNGKSYRLNLIERNVSHDGYANIKSTLHILLKPIK